MKLVWNIAFNGLGVAAVAGYEAVARTESDLRSLKVTGPCLPTDVLLGDGRWCQLVRDLMGEVIAAATALGHPIEPGYADAELERTRGMGSYRASTLLDFERGLPLELENLFLEPLRQAHAAGVPMPRLEALSHVLIELAVRRRRG